MQSPELLSFPVSCHFTQLSLTEGEHFLKRSKEILQVKCF